MKMDNEIKTFPLRPHHGLCIRFYSGHGYDQKFTDNMNAFLGELKEDSAIALTLGADILCACCPNRVGGICTSDEKSTKYDTAVIHTTGLKYGDVLTWSVFQKRLTDAIFRKGKFDEICGDCSWQALCHKACDPQQLP